MNINAVKTIANDMDYLRQISKKVEFDDKQLLNDINILKNFCKNNEVLAMAAVQLGIPKRIIYIRNTNLDMINKFQKDEIKDNDYDESQVLINPVITKKIGLTTYWEACASCLDNVGLVERPYIIEIEYYDLNNEKHVKIFEGFPATVISHEYDHLNGILHMDISLKNLNIILEERKKLRQKEGYEMINKDGNYDELKKVKIYNKLVRDNIPDIMIKNGANPVTHILNDEDYLKELNKKLFEETNEYLESGDVLELADIEEVLLAILNTKNISQKEFQEIRNDKVKKRGSFNKKIFLEKEI